MATAQSLKRRAEDWSSDDDDRPMFPLRKVVRREADLPDFSSKSTTLHLNCQLVYLIELVVRNTGVSSDSLQESLANALPLSMIDDAVKTYLIWQSNKRLEQARDERVNIRDISIGEDGWPVWPTICWDSSIEPLHVMIRQNLDNLEVSQRLGSLIREEIIKKGNKRLQKAKEEGISLENIFVGKTLLPEWRDWGVEAEGSKSADSQQLSDTIESSSLQTTLSTASEEAAVGSIWTSFLSSFAPVQHSSDSDDSESDFDLGPAIDRDRAKEQQENIFYSISLNNLVDDRPYFSDASVGVFQDAEVAGAPRNHTNIDFELRAATEEDEAEDLPEAEFAVDRDAFEYYFESDEAFDIAVTGIPLSCTGEIEDIIELDGDGIDQDENETRLPIQPVPSSPIATTIPGGVSPQTLDLTSTRIDERDTASVISEEATSDEEMIGDIFEETEDGFQW